MRTQLQMHREAELRLFADDMAFMDMVNDPHQPDDEPGPGAADCPLAGAVRAVLRVRGEVG